MKLAHPEAAIQRERTWRVGLENLKPDITMSINGKLTFVEVTIPYEKDSDVLNRRESEKEHKYSKLTAAELEMEDIHETETIGIAIGAAGTINKSTVEKLKKLGIARHAKALQMIAMHYSSTIWKIHERT